VTRGSPIAGLALALAAGAGIAGLGATAPLDRAALDAQFAFLRRHFPEPVREDVLVVGIDEATAAGIAEPLALWHRHIGDFLEAAAQAGARGVAVDLVLPDRGYDGIAPGYDARLTAGLIAMRRAGALVLAQTVDEGGRPRKIHAPFVAAAGPEGIGFALWPLDRDGVVRRFDETLGAAGEVVPTLAGQLAHQLGFVPRNGLINFAIGEPISYLPLGSILAWRREAQAAKLTAALGGRILLLGSVLPFTDHHRSSIALGAWAPDDRANPGVLLHAQALRSIMADRIVRPAPLWLVVLLGAAFALAWLVDPRPRYWIPAGLLIVTAAAALGTAALARDLYLPTAALAGAGLLALGARVGLATVASLRERRRLRSVFGGYVSPQVMTEIEAGRFEGGASARRFLCVLFLDVRGFTSRSESMAPEPMIELLNSLFEAATDAIHARGGTVDKFTGDGLMAFFGAPAPHANPCAPAFDAARDILRRLEVLNHDLVARSMEPVAIGLGLACGDTVVGHVGAERRHAYTAIGDCVNVAARLEGLSKELGYPLILSSEVAARVTDDGRLARLGAQALKGHSPVEVYGWK
jgi:class 3 adenylate cyclase